MAINYLSLTGLTKYDAQIKAFVEAKVNEGDAKSFKYVNLVDGVLKFYTVNPIADDTVPAYEIELPEQDLSHLMQLVQGATANNVAIFDENGQVKDGGLAVADIATKAEVQAVQGAVDELTNYVGDIPEGYTETTIIGYINKKAEETLNSASGGSSESAASVLAALNTYKSENDPRVQANTDAIEVLNGDSTVEGSVDKKVADAINTFATQITDDGTINTFKEVLNYISTHSGEATEMMAAIDQLETLVGDKAVATQIAEAIEAENLGQYATDEELAAAIARIVVLEVKAHEHTNQTILDGITAEKVAAWDAAEQNAITAAETKDAAILTQAKEDATNKVAEVNATIGEVTEGKTVVQMIADAQTAATYNDEEVRGLISTNATDIDNLEKLHADDKAELVADIEANAQAVADLEASLVEISEEQINALFPVE